MVIGVRQVLDYSDWEGRHRLFDRLIISWCITFLIFLPILIGRAVMGY
jgi:hypothetical protein